MLLGGDEFGRTQKGNNNAWCQDNELSWFDWDTVDHELQEFARGVIALRRREPVFRRRDFFLGDHGSSGLPDVMWLKPDGHEMTESDWGRDDAHALGVFLNGMEIPTHDRQGNPIEGASFLILFNAHFEALDFTIAESLADGWTAVIDTAGGDEAETYAAGDTVTVESRSTVALRRR
jgi:glycogen operon protein